MGNWQAVTFSKEQQQRFGVGETGEVAADGCGTMPYMIQYDIIL